VTAAFSLARPILARSHILVDSYPTVGESFTRLQRAGWSVCDVRVLTTQGPTWLGSGHNGENAFSARGVTQAEAWHKACQQLEAVGMLRGQG
jgi:hypothetical protein